MYFIFIYNFALPRTESLNLYINTLITKKSKKSTIYQKIIASENNRKLSKLIAIKNEEINIGKDEKPASLIIRLFSFLNTKKSKSNDEIL